MNKTPSLSFGRCGRLVLVAALLLPSAVEVACYQAPSTGNPGTGGDASGAAGTTGSAGDSGTAGTTGSGGDVGTAGTTGAAGSTGPGSAGTTGSTGAAGTTGTAGTTGATGTAGTTGAAGRGGTTGTAGTTGAAGRGGTTGTAGTGAAGRGGTTGTAGTTGAAGRGGTTGTGGTGGGRTTNLRVMLLGDSTTSAICFRSDLWQLLTNSGRTKFDFIGTRKGDPGCSFTGYDQDNEGHGGYIVTDILKSTSTGRPSGADPTDLFDSSARDLATWFDGHPADAVLMHFGTNDVWNNIAPATILNALTAILTKLRAVNPNVRMLVAQITPLNPSGCSACVSRVQTLNSMIPAWATQNNTAQSPVTVVDQATNFNVATDTNDGVHANVSGSMKIAMQWFNALIPIY